MPQDAGWILITGASRGIGQSLAESLGCSGYKLLLWARDRLALDRLSTKIGTGDSHLRTFQVDVTDPDQVAAAAEATSAVGKLQAIVINAGVGSWKSIAETEVHEWRRMVDTNLTGAFHTLHALLPQLTKNPDGQIIGIASDSSIYPFPGRAAYCASKAGLYSLLETVRAETRTAGIRTTIVVPSRVDTNFRGKEPGGRPDALKSNDISALLKFILAVPRHVEIREVHLAARTDSFGPYVEAYGSRNVFS